MPFLKTLPENAGPPAVYKTHPHVYGPFSEMSESIMNGPSPLTSGEREAILAYAAGLMGCEFVYLSHSEVAYAWGMEQGTLELILHDLDLAPISSKLRALLRYVKKLAISPTTMTQADADGVINAGWDEKALHDAVAVTARAAFMQILVSGIGFEPLPPGVAASHAKKRVEKGYVNIYRAFRKQE